MAMGDMTKFVQKLGLGSYENVKLAGYLVKNYVNLVTQVLVYTNGK